MAKSPRNRRKSKTKRSMTGAAKSALFLLVISVIVAGYAWNEGQAWRPDESVWPDQGVLVGADDGIVDFGTIEGLGAKFAYLESSDGAGRKDPEFARNLAMARETGLEVGAVHRFDPCALADGQSANFVTMVPRDSNLLPPAIMLDKTAQACPGRVSDAAIQSELMTLVNQIEAHTGSPVILAPSADFEAAYGITRKIDRQIWLTRSWFEPEYAARPWLMWTANRFYLTEASDLPLRWVVVRP